MRLTIDNILIITLDLFEDRLPIITGEILSLHLYLVDCYSWRVNRKSLTEVIWHNKQGQPWSQEFVDAYKRLYRDQQYSTLFPTSIPKLPEVENAILCSVLAKNYEKSSSELLALAQNSKPMQTGEDILNMQLIEESPLMKAWRLQVASGPSARRDIKTESNK